MGIRLSDQEDLKTLVSFLNPSDTSFSCWLEACVSPELKRVWNSFRSEKYVPKLSPVPKEISREQALAYAQDYLVALEHFASLAQLEQIVPLLGFTLDEHGPDFELHKPAELSPWQAFQAVKSQYKLISSKLNNPLFILSGARYGMIHFQSVKDPLEIKSAKQFIECEVPKRYEIIGISAYFRPRHSTSDHYYSRFSSECSFRVHNNWFTFDGNWDFQEREPETFREFCALFPFSLQEQPKQLLATTNS